MDRMKKLLELLNCQVQVRQRGHTYAAIHGALKSNALLVVRTDRDTERHKKKYPNLKTITIRQLQKRLAENKMPQEAIVFDNAVLFDIVAQISKLTKIRLPNREKISKHLFEVGM